MKRKLNALRQDGFYEFEYERFAEVLALRSTESSTISIPVTSQAETALINSLQKNDPHLFPPIAATQQTNLTLNALELAWKDFPNVVANARFEKYDAINCARLRCSIYQFYIKEETPGYLDIISDPATGKVLSASGQFALLASLHSTEKLPTDDGDFYQLATAVFKPFIPASYSTADALSPRFSDWVSNTSAPANTNISRAMLDEVRAKSILCSFGSSMVLGTNNDRFVISTTPSHLAINVRYGF
jgi:hypothetical protein